MRIYEKTHPWISFKLDLRQLDCQTWLLLGEALSKCEHIAGVPLAPDIARELNTIYLTKGVHATTQIEGNTLSEEDVRKQIDGELRVPPSKEYLQQEIANILEGCNRIIEEVADGTPLQITPDRTLWFNQVVLEKLPPREGSVPGRIRTKGVEVGNVYRGAPAEDCEFLVDKLCTWLEELRSDAPDELKKPVDILLAIVAHVYIAWIHPFGDGNGRTARLIEVQVLARASVPMVAAHLLSDHYNITRTEYYRQLRLTSTRAPYRLDDFIKYAIQGFVDGLRAQIEVVRSHQLEVIWQNFVHDAFHEQVNKSTKVCVRQRRLALSLDPFKPTPRAAVRTLTPELAVDYAQAGPRVASRDINALQEMGLIRSVKGGILADISQVQAFLPLRAEEEKPHDEDDESEDETLLAA